MSAKRSLCVVTVLWQGTVVCAGVRWWEMGAYGVEGGYGRMAGDVVRE